MKLTPGEYWHVTINGIKSIQGIVSSHETKVWMEPIACNLRFEPPATCYDLNRVKFIGKF